MSNDRLSEATRALRETEDVSELEARSTRARVLTGLHQTRVRRRTRLVFLLPIAATFVAVSAWGAANGKAQHAFETLELWFTPAAHSNANLPSQRRTRPTAAAKPTLASSASAMVPDAASVSAPAAVPVAASVPDPASVSPSAPAPAPTLAPVVPGLARSVALSVSAVAPRSASHAAAEPSAAGPSDPLLALYRRAHTAHFVDRDPARALVAWDAYLAAAPLGPFAPEARYNRALSLVRLGRKAEARAALEPFASGGHGGYRQDEARALLERLGE